jgi:hypothetical protein
MHKPSSRNSSHYILKKHLKPYFGQKPMDFSESTVQEWISSMKLQGKLGTEDGRQSVEGPEATLLEDRNS